MLVEMLSTPGLELRITLATSRGTVAARDAEGHWDR
jgi:hypothetical protein